MLRVSQRAAHLFAACVGCMVALAAGPMGCGSGAERAERHVERAREFLAEQNREAATIELHIAAQADPANREASWLLAQIAISEGKLEEAIFYLREAHRAQPEDTRAALELASLLYGSNPATARKLVEDAIEREPDDPKARRVLALVAVAMGDTATATRAARRGVELDPENPESYWTLGWVHQALIRRLSLLAEPPKGRHFKMAIEAFDGYIARGGGHPWKARLEQARIYAAWPGRSSEAAQMAGRAMDAARDSGDASAMLQAAAHMSELARSLGSRRLQALAIGMLLEVDPSDLQAWKTLADLREASGGSADAVYREMLDSLPDDADAHILYARYLIRSRGLGAALAHFDEKAAEGVDPPRMLAAQINLYYASHQPELAARTFARLESSYPDHPWTKLQRAQEWIRAGKPGEALLILDSLATTQPFPEALGLLASTELALGNRRAAGRAARAALDMSRRFDPKAWSELARALHAAGDYSSSAELLSDLQRRSTLSDSQRLMLARSQYEIGETRSARLALLEMAFRDEPSEAAIRMLVKQESRVPAREVWLREALESAHERNPDELVYLRLLTSLDLKSKRNRAARDRLGRSLKRWPRSVERLLMRAQVADQLGRGDMALSDARRAFAIKPKQKELADFVLALHARHGGVDESIAELEKALAAPDAWVGRKAPGSANRSQLLSNLYLLKGSGDEALATLERANHAAEGTPALQSHLAYRLASSGGDLRRSFSLARQAHRGAPHDPEVLDTLGFVHLQRGEHPRALDFVRQAILLASPPQPLYHYHESLALQALGRDREALIAIKTVLALSPDYPGAAQIRAELESDPETPPPTSS